MRIKKSLQEPIKNIFKWKFPVGAAFMMLQHKLFELF